MAEVDEKCWLSICVCVYLTTSISGEVCANTCCWHEHESNKENPSGSPAGASPGLHAMSNWCHGLAALQQGYKRTKVRTTKPLLSMSCAFKKETKAGNTAVTQLWSNPDGMMWLCPLRILHEKEEEVDHKDQRRKEDVCLAERRIPSWCSRWTFIWNQTVRSAHRHSLQNSTDTYWLFLRTKGCSRFPALKTLKWKSLRDGRNGPQPLDQGSTISRFKKQGPDGADMQVQHFPGLSNEQLPWILIWKAAGESQRLQDILFVMLVKEPSTAAIRPAQSPAQHNTTAIEGLSIFHPLWERLNERCCLDGAGRGLGLQPRQCSRFLRICEHSEKMPPRQEAQSSRDQSASTEFLSYVLFKKDKCFLSK